MTIFHSPDIITQVNSKPVSSAADVRQITLSDGDNVEVTVLDSSANFRPFVWNVKCNLLNFLSLIVALLGTVVEFIVGKKAEVVDEKAPEN